MYRNAAFKLFILLVLVTMLLPASTAARVVTEDEFQGISPQDAVAEMGAGWNLGNTLDAIETEGSWNNDPVEEATFDDIKAAGFKSVRIPVTWTHHIEDVNGYKVYPVWMERVEKVIDMALERDLYVVLNVHHDSWEWLDMSKITDPNDREAAKEKFVILWEQIADRFKDKDEKLLFEILNEPAGEGSDEQEADYSAQYNDMNKRVLEVIRQSGGHNEERLVLLTGLRTDIQDTMKGFEHPNPDDKNLILTVHNYDDWDYVSNWWGHTNWGDTEYEQNHFDEYFGELDQWLADNNYDMPVIIGEYGTLASNEYHDKWYYHDLFVSAAYKYGMHTMWWDNGADHFDRVNREFRDPIVKDIIINAANGIDNSFVELATLYIEENDEITDTSLELTLNSNSFVNIIDSNDNILVRGMDYKLNNDGDIVTLTAEYLKSVVTEIGVNEKLTFDFSKGADPTVDLVKYGTPVLEQTTITQDEEGTELKIPTDFNGTTLATVKARKIVEGEEVALKDAWTMEEWRPEHQRGRLNQNDDFWTDGENVYISEYVMGLIGEDEAALTFEFWPRERSTNVVVKVNAKE